MNRILAIIAFCLLLSCNSKQTEYQRLRIEVWGTNCDIIYEPSDKANEFTLLVNLFEELNASINTYDSTSLLSKINSNSSNAIDPHIHRLLELSAGVHAKSNGVFDPTIRPVVQKWGFLRQEGNWVDTQELAQLMPEVGLNQWEWDSNQIIEKPKDASIDFNAIAPGYAADLIAWVLDSIQLKNYYINNGGELRLKGKNEKGLPWKVAITSPFGGLKNWGDTLFAITDTAMATSGNYRNRFEHEGITYSHTISVKTGMPVQTEIVSATIFSSSSALADAYATVCMALNFNEAKAFIEENNLHAYLIYKDDRGKVQRYLH